MITNLADLWETVADTVPDRPLVIHGDLVRSWSEYEDRASRLAGALLAMGVEAGDKVAIDLWNCAENLEVIFASFKIRAVPFNINYRYKEHELAQLLSDARPVVIVYDDALADRVSAAIELADRPVVRVVVNATTPPAEGVLDYDELIATAAPAARIERVDDDEFIIYTGGTTGNPKGVVWGHNTAVTFPVLRDRAVEDMEEYVEALVSGPSPIRLIISPMMHGTGMMTAISTLTAGGTVVFCTSRSLNPAEVAELIERHHITGFAVVGDAIAKPILEELDRARDEGRAHDLSSLLTINNTGAFWSAPVKKGFLRHGSFTIVDGINATESAGFATSEARTEDEIETGKFRLGPHARVITEDGRDVVPGSGEVGMLATTGRLPKGYLNDPEKSAKAWPMINGVRYCVPGDMATLEEDGTVTLLGRSSEIVNTGGEKVFVEEVEVAVLNHPDVADVSVIGLPDERWGRRVTAVVALRPGAVLTDRNIIDHVGMQLADYKRPRQVVFVAEIPRAPTGKADRTAAKLLAEATIAAGEKESAAASSAQSNK